MDWMWIVLMGGLPGVQVLRAALTKGVMAMFSDPVPRGETYYHEIITRPMDLGTISARLSRGHYKTLGGSRNPCPCN